MDKVIKKIHDHTREQDADHYKLKYYDKNATLEILTPLIAHISELRVFENNKIVVSQHYKRQDQVFCPITISNNFKIPKILKNNKYLYILFAINYVLAEKDLN